MRKIYPKKLTLEAFRPYGEFFPALNPDGPRIGDVFTDVIHYPSNQNVPIAFSVYAARKQSPIVVNKAEYHNYASEFILPLDDDIIIHVAPLSKEKVPEHTESFFVPKGTMVKLYPGVWHLESYPINEEKVHIIIGLPERTYKTDCTIEEYREEEWIEIIPKVKS